MFGASLGSLPKRQPGVVDALGAGVDPKANDVADDRGVRGARRRPHIAPPHQHGPGAGEELLEGRGAGVGVDLIGRVGPGCDQVHHILNGLHPAGLLTRGFIVSGSNSHAGSSGCLA
jgi:hypothetical protein